MGRKTTLFQGMVASCPEIGYGVKQRAVKIKDNKRFHNAYIFIMISYQF